MGSGWSSEARNGHAHIMVKEDIEPATNKSATQQRSVSLDIYSVNSAIFLNSSLAQCGKPTAEGQSPPKCNWDAIFGSLKR